MPICINVSMADHDDDEKKGGKKDENNNNESAEKYLGVIFISTE